MSHNHVPAAVALAAILFGASCTQTQSEPPVKRAEPPTSGLQANTVKQFAFPGGTFMDGTIRVSPDTKVEPGAAKNVVTLMRPNGNGITVSCFCTLQGGDCWAVSNDLPGGGVGVGCASQNCAGGGEPFCFMDIGGDAAGFDIRLAVPSRR